jgi:hypothetical protein
VNVSTCFIILQLTFMSFYIKWRVSVCLTGYSTVSSLILKKIINEISHFQQIHNINFNIKICWCLQDNCCFTLSDCHFSYIHDELNRWCNGKRARLEYDHGPGQVKLKTIKFVFVKSIKVKQQLSCKHQHILILKLILCICWKWLISFIIFFRISELTVEDPVRHTEKIPVFINITLPNMKCECEYMFYYSPIDIHVFLHKMKVLRGQTHRFFQYLPKWPVRDALSIGVIVRL